MDAHALLKNELIYELHIRGLRSDGTVSDLRQRLNRACSENIQPKEDIVGRLDLLEELACCRSKFDVLQALVAELEEERFEPAEYRRVDSRLWHLYYRIARLPVRPGEDDGAPLLNEVKDLWDKLKQLCYGMSGMRGNVLVRNAPAVGNPGGQAGAAGADGQGNRGPNISFHPSPARTNPFLWDNEGTFEPVDRNPLGTVRSEQQRAWSGLQQMGPQPPTTTVGAGGLGEQVRLDSSLRRPDSRPNTSALLYSPQLGTPLRYAVPGQPAAPWNGVFPPAAEPMYPYYALPQPVTPVNHHPAPQNPAGPVWRGHRDLKLYKWGFKFTGDDGGMNLANFLEKVAGMMGSRGVTDWEILPSVGELLDGTASIVYQANRHRLTNWGDFVSLLRANFRDPDYDVRLFDEIRRRTQGKEESVGVYMAKMRCLFNRLSYPLPEVQKVSLVERNFRPELLPFLARCTCTSLDQLEAELTRVEVWTRRAARFQDPPSSRSALEPDLAYGGGYGNLRAVPKIAAVQSVPDSEKYKRRVMVCWNCKEPHHTYFKCKEPLTVFCRRCGNDGVATESCTRCKRPENSEGRGPTATGNLLQL